MPPLAREGGFRGGSGGRPGTARGRKKWPKLSRLGELLNTQKNVHFFALPRGAPPGEGQKCTSRGLPLGGGGKTPYLSTKNSLFPPDPAQNGPPGGGAPGGARGARGGPGRPGRPARPGPARPGEIFPARAARPGGGPGGGGGGGRGPLMPMAMRLCWAAVTDTKATPGASDSRMRHPSRLT